MTRGNARLPLVVFILGGAAALGGCADATGDALQQDVAQLRQDVNALRLSVARGTGGGGDTLAQVDRRLRDQSADTTRQINALTARIESLSAEVNRLSARLDDAPGRPGASSGRRTPGGDLGSSSSELVPSSPVLGGPSAGSPARPEPGTPGAVIAAPPSPPSRPSPTPPPGTGPGTSPAPRSTSPSARPSAGNQEADDAFQAASSDFSRGRYPMAIAGFRDFLRRFPNSPLADSAQYGIGEAYYSQATAAAAEGQGDSAKRSLEQAVQEFRKVSIVYPRGSKVPTALYKEALALAELKQTALAQARLQYLVDNFPQSEEAPLAKERLASMRR